MKLTDLFHRADTITPDDAGKMISDKGDEIMLVDVREPNEYEKEHMPGAVLMPMSVFPERMKELDPSKKIVTY
ncbi:MAG: rhodanese-like domain-containing protein [Nitrospiraceae bacterium]|nr:MAG: rhodanese-like domain-containing protein [Nitrospiraceae bacterium]